MWLCDVDVAVTHSTSHYHVLVTHFTPCFVTSLHHIAPNSHILLHCSHITCRIMCTMWCTMRCGVMSCGFVIWNGAWCGAMWNEICYSVTIPCFATSHHHSSIIPHLTAQHSTLHHISSCNAVHTMLCHIVPPHTAHHVRCGVLCHVFCDMEWACGMWCGAMWNVLQCYHTVL